MSMVPTHLMIFGAVLFFFPVAGSVPAIAAISCALVDTVYICAAATAEPPLVPPDWVAHPTSATAVDASAALAVVADTTPATATPPATTATAPRAANRRRAAGMPCHLCNLTCVYLPGK